MDIEQLPPNRPNFQRVLLLSAAALLLIFGVALYLLRTSGTELTPHHVATPSDATGPATSGS
ncbi:hypothetical protein ACFQBQ_05170 [Granulicella cerasi]|uniref:Uncharacterized protein n=1 Tax=Granulicella cerasi TaxID=741063 RepID=A0ABW1Z8Z4_9BACT|nr:hypothetical protein [Granulicella cerasi]